MKKKLLKISKLFTIISILTLSLTNLSAQTGAALNFDGINDYAAASVFTTTGNNNFSLETAVKITTASPTNQFIVYNCNTASSGFGFFVSSNSTSLSILFGGVAFNNTTYTLTPGVWTYLTATFASGTLKFYVNGVLTQTLSSSNPVAPTTGSFVVGSDNLGGSNFIGSIDETRLWSRVLCPAEILNNYNGEFASIQPGLLAYYRYNQGIASSSNTTITSAINAVGGNNLALNNFSLTGTASNWVAPGAVVSGSYVPSYVSISSPSVICQGSSATLTATTSATSYTWSNSSTNMAISVSPTATSVYSIVATNTAGCMGSANFTLNVSPCTGIKNQNNNFVTAINIYPNPSNGVFNIETIENAEIEIFNPLGKQITKLKTETVTTLNLREYGSGLYIANVKVNGENRSFKLIVQ